MLTDFARERAPEGTWVVVVGGGAIGTLRISPTAGGVEEDATVAVGHRVEDPAPLADLPALAAVLVAEHRLVSALAQLRVGRADLTSSPRFEPSGTPVAFVVGSEGVADVGRRHAETPPLPDRPLPLGTPGSPGLYYPLGDDRPPHRRGLDSPGTPLPPPAGGGRLRAARARPVPPAALPIGRENRRRSGRHRPRHPCPPDAGPCGAVPRHIAERLAAVVSFARR